MTRGTPGPAAGGTSPDAAAGDESFAELLGGRRAAIDATLPPVAFVVGWLVQDGSVLLGAGMAVGVAAALAAYRARQGVPARAVLLGLLGVAAAALVALWTGRAADFFLVQVASNAASALAWIVSIAFRWPLLGVVVGTALGQKTSWRRDPALIRAYGWGSWVWVCQYALRLLVFVPLWMAGEVVALGAARVVLSWPLVAASLAASWWVVRRTLPPGHPGLRHPR